MRFSITSLLLAMLIILPLQAGEHSLRAVPGLKKGMSREAVKEILGKPKQIKIQNPCWGMEERWWYERSELKAKVILFTDGKLDKIEPAQAKR